MKKIKYQGLIYREACISPQADVVKEWESMVMLLSKYQRHLGLWESDVRNGSRFLTPAHVKELGSQLEGVAYTLQNLTAKARDTIVNLRLFIESSERGENPIANKEEPKEAL